MGMKGGMFLHRVIAASKLRHWRNGFALETLVWSAWCSTSTCGTLRASETRLSTKYEKSLVSGLDALRWPVSPGSLTTHKSRVADRILVLWPGVRLVPPRWESWVQDIGPPETSWLHVISNGESSPRDLHLNSKTQLHLTTSKLQCWTPYAKQLARQEHNPTH